MHRSDLNTVAKSINLVTAPLNGYKIAAGFQGIIQAIPNAINDLSVRPTRASSLDFT